MTLAYLLYLHWLQDKSCSYEVKHYERGWSEVLKIIRDLIQPELCYIELDGRKVGTIYAFEGWHDRIREALEEREATPEEGYLLEEQGREIATLDKRLANAELLIEKLKEEVKELNFSVALHDRAAEKARAIWEEAHPDKAPEWLCREDLMVWLIERVERADAVKESLTSALRDIKKNVDDWNLQDYVTIRRLVNAALRTAEDSSVVGLIDSTPAKQFPNAVNADGDWDILNDIETSLRAKTEVMKSLLESQTLSPELAALGRELVRLAEKSLGEVEE